MSITAFCPLGLTYAIPMTTSVSLPVQPQVTTTYGAMQCRIINYSNYLTYLGVGMTAAAAVTNANAPTGGAPTLAVPLLPGTDEVFTFPQGSWFAAVTTQGTATLYITTGDGM